jgi:hypothetical protein
MRRNLHQVVQGHVWVPEVPGQEALVAIHEHLLGGMRGSC